MELQHRARPAARLTLDSARVAQVGTFLPGTEAQEVKFDAVANGRFFCLETLSAYDGRAYAAVAELDLLDESGNAFNRSGWSIAYADSEEWERENGLAENVFDGQTTTFWHTQWGRASPNHPHHLVFDLGRSQKIAGFRYVPRPGDGAVGGRIKDYRIYIGDDLVDENVKVAALPARCYLFAYFTGNGEDGLHLAYSLNGYRWEVMDRGRSFLKPEVTEGRLMRDPCLARGPDGTFHLVWTAAWSGNEIGYASSRDLVHWSPQRALPVMADEPGTANCWAPEIFRDARREEFLIYWASTVTGDATDSAANPPANHNRIYYTTTKDFKTFSPTRILFNPGFSVIDATLLQSGERFYLIFKNEAMHRLRVAVGRDAEGPFGDISAPLSPGRVEGPTAFRLGGQYLVAFHFIGGDRFGALKSPDFEHWEDVSAGMSLPAGRQGTIVELPGSVLKPLQDAGRLELGASPEAAELGIGDWIWTTNVTDKQTCHLWRQFNVPRNSPVVRAELQMTADNGYTVFLDGREVGRGGDVNCVTRYDLTWLLSPGPHVLAVEAFNETMDAGVVLGLRMKLANGRSLDVLSDSTWRIADGDNRAWRTALQASPSWPAAQVVGYAGKAWWQYPYKILESPPLRPPVVHFWQQSWFLIILLLLCLAVLSVCVRLGLSLVLHARAQRLLERERARIARDIHDDLGAGLTQLTLLGELVLRESPREAGTNVRVNELCARSRSLLKSMDEIVWTVNSRRDTVQDFAAFVSEHAQEFLSTTSIRCRLEVAEELPAIALDLPKRRNLMLAVKEAIRNVARHSGATELNLKVRLVQQNLEVIVEDNGSGFAPGQTHEMRNGLANMQQRLSDIAGTCSITSRPGAGCRVVFVLPLPAPRLPHGWFSRLAGWPRPRHTMVEPIE
jgi:two-component sensor histidine kinase